MPFTRPPAEFVRFLNKHPVVCDTLIDCWEPIRRIFGEVPVYMNLEEDPTDTTTKIHVDIQWPHDANDGYERLKRFDEEWWLDRIQIVGDELMFNIELR